MLHVYIDLDTLFFISLQFKLDSLMLTERARNKMVEIAGPRYNPERGTIRLVGKRYVCVKVFGLDQLHVFVLFGKSNS